MVEWPNGWQGRSGSPCASSLDYSQIEPTRFPGVALLHLVTLSEALSYRGATTGVLEKSGAFDGLQKSDV